MGHEEVAADDTPLVACPMNLNFMTSPDKEHFDDTQALTDPLCWEDDSIHRTDPTAINKLIPEKVKVLQRESKGKTGKKRIQPIIVGQTNCKSKVNYSAQPQSNCVGCTAM